MRKEDNSDIGEIKEHQKNNLVFAHSQNQLGQTVYKFIGEFNVSFDKSDNSKHIYIRKNTNVVLNHRS